MIQRFAKRSERRLRPDEGGGWRRSSLQVSTRRPPLRGGGCPGWPDAEDSRRVQQRRSETTIGRGAPPVAGKQSRSCAAYPTGSGHAAPFVRILERRRFALEGKREELQARVQRTETVNKRLDARQAESAVN